GVEARAAAPWLPGLRNEAVLKLGEDISNWSFDGPSAAEQQFWPILYGSRDDVRHRIADMLGCCLAVTTRELRFYSPSDISYVSNNEFERGIDRRTPRFSIDAHEMADRIKNTCNGSLFLARSS